MGTQNAFEVRRGARQLRKQSCAILRVAQSVECSCAIRVAQSGELRNLSCAILRVAQSKLRNPSCAIRPKSCAIRVAQSSEVSESDFIRQTANDCSLISCEPVRHLRHLQSLVDCAKIFAITDALVFKVHMVQLDAICIDLICLRIFNIFQC